MDAKLILIIMFSMCNLYTANSASDTSCSCADKVSNLEETITEMEAKLNRTIAALYKPRDCQDVFNNGYTSDGIYTIYPGGFNPVIVRCNMTTDGGGWTVMQLRQSDSDFYKTWDQYVVGFGDDNFTNYWLGLESIHALTKQALYELKIDMKDRNGKNASAKYKIFKVGDVLSRYELYVDTYSYDKTIVNAGDSLSYHSGMKFSTRDRDNDRDGGACSVRFRGGWWYKNCHQSNLNGDWGNKQYAKGPVWKSFTGYYNPLTFTQMMIRKQNSVQTINVSSNINSQVN